MRIKNKKYELSLREEIYSKDYEFKEVVQLTSWADSYDEVGILNKIFGTASSVIGIANDTAKYFLLAKSNRKDGKDLMDKLSFNIRFIILFVIAELLQLYQYFYGDIDEFPNDLMKVSIEGSLNMLKNYSTEDIISAYDSMVYKSSKKKVEWDNFSTLERHLFVLFYYTQADISKIENSIYDV